MVLFTFLDFILPNLIILLAIWKVENVGMKWYVINLMAAYSIGSIGRSVGLEFEKRPELYEGTLFSILYGLTIYLRAATFALTRLIVFFCILEIYSIYAFKTKILKALYKRKSRVFIFIYSCALVIAIPVTSLTVTENKLITAIVVMIYLGTIAILYLSSIIIICAAIHTAYKHKLLSQNQQLKNALTPLILYFLPITVIDTLIAVSGIILVINIDTNVLKVFLQVNAATVRIRATFLALYTIFVLPPFRRAMFDLLGFKRHQRSSVVPLNATNLTVGRNGM